MSRSISIVWHPQAIAEARAARLWYKERNELAAEAIVTELDFAVAQISDFPDRWLEVVPGFRRFLMKSTRLVYVQDFR
jgi:plasmid stabilization system protein ParE